MPLVFDRSARSQVMPKPPQRFPSRDATARVGRLLARLVTEALQIEVAVTPKPGLVDLRNCGAHRDMCVATFSASIAALHAFWMDFFRVGVSKADLPATVALEHLRVVGLAAEHAMGVATGGVNTHKGAIFAFGLFLGAAGRVWSSDGELRCEAICEEVGRIAQGIVRRELEARDERRTAGERLFRTLGLTGARGEAASGFMLVRFGALPVLGAALGRGEDIRIALLRAFLHLLAHNNDTNLAARGGQLGLTWAKAQASTLMAETDLEPGELVKRLEALDDAFIVRNLSPGGSADLLALTWIMHRLGEVQLSSDRNWC